MKRILYTVLNGNIAGGQVVCYNIMKAAEEAGYRPMLLSQTQGPFTNLMEKMGIRVYTLPLKRSFHFHKILGIVKILKNEKIDLVHTHGSVAGNILVRMAAFLSGIPVISHLHIKNHFSRNRISCLFTKSLDNLTAEMCKKIIAVSEATKKALVFQGYVKSKIEVVYNTPVRLPVLNGGDDMSLLGELDTPENPIIFLHIGRLCPNKGQADFIEATKHVLEIQKDVYSLIVGEDYQNKGGYVRRLESMLTTEIMRKRIKLLGFRWDTDRLIRISRALVLSSYEEGFPLVILDAMRNKKPVIAFDSDGVVEQINDSVNGYLVKKGDIGGLINAMLKIIRNPAESEKMGLNGYGLLNEKFNHKKQINRMLSIYREII